MSVFLHCTSSPCVQTAGPWSFCLCGVCSKCKLGSCTCISKDFRSEPAPFCALARTGHLQSSLISVCLISHWEGIKISYHNSQLQIGLPTSCFPCPATSGSPELMGRGHTWGGHQAWASLSLVFLCLCSNRFSGSLCI